MKFNKWTLGLAAVGVVSLASAARADEKLSSLQTALSNTTISGFVSASANWEAIGGAGVSGEPARSPAGYISQQGGKQDGFNLDVVRLTIAKPEDESPWASGYDIDLAFGPDAVGYNPVSTSANGTGSTGGDVGIKQAYVTLRTPVGNGIDWKFGVFDTIIGYEVTDSASDPNYTRSIGYAVEPTEHTGVLASYKINDEFSVSAGVANTLAAGINSRAFNYSKDTYQSEPWHKTLMGSITYTAPSSWGWAAGSSIYAGVVWGFNGGSDYGYNGYHSDGDQFNGYAGATINTPWKQFTAGIAFDYVGNYNGGYDDQNDNNHNTVEVVGLYGTYKATDKLSFDGRGEYFHGQDDYSYTGGNEGYSSEGFELTGTAEYDLWANVMTRVEVRYDHFGSYDTPYAVYDGNDAVLKKDSVGFYANVIYKF
jgi:hypothetical protein